MVAGVAVVAGVVLVIVRESRAPAATEVSAAPQGGPVATWPSGSRRAPGFRLNDQHGVPISLALLRGRPVVVTFIDPLCRNLCPLEAKVLMQMARQVPAAKRPTVVSVSVNPRADSLANFALDQQHWQLDASWRWAMGPQTRLARVWRDYGIGVQVVTKVVAGVTVRSVVHTEGSYVIDRDGYERALFLYPFTADDVAKTVMSLS